MRPAFGAGDAGRIAVMFPGTEAPDPSDMSRPWNTYVVVSTDALDADPLFLSAIANPGGPADPVHRGYCEVERCANMYDFLDIVTAPDARTTAWSSG